MYRLILFVVTSFLCSCATTSTWYIVRHAEKESGTTMTATTVKTSDVPLSAEGTQRAEELKNQLQNKKVNYIYSTNTIRTKTTVTPLSQAIGIPIQIYNAIDTSFVQQLKN